MELHPSEKRNTIITVIGRKGSGKSTLVREIMNSGQYPRIFVLDTNGEYKKEDGFLVTDTVTAGARAMVRVRTKPEFRVSLRDPDTEKLVRLLDIAFEIPHTLVVVEEAHFYIKSPSHLPVQFSKLVRMGRHRAISQIYVAQRPTGLHRDMTAQSDYLVTFRQYETRDIDWLSKVAGDEDIEQVKELPDYKVRVWTFGDPAKMPLPIVARIHEPMKNKKVLDIRGEVA